MSLRDDLVSEKVDLLIAELRLLGSSGPHFRVLHRFREPGVYCAPGEEIAAIYFIYRSIEILVPLSLTLRILFDFFAKHRHLPQSASQIAAGIGGDPFYRNHGINADGRTRLTRKISRPCVKELVQRIRRALAIVFEEAHLAIDPSHVLKSDKTITNEVGYRLNGTCELLHVDDPRFVLPTAVRRIGTMKK